MPKFYKPRSFRIKNKVETEIERLVNSNIFVPIDHCEWATIIISILQPDGTVRLCGDFKITLNLLLEGYLICFRKFNIYMQI